jgi:hypothetical protein
MVPTAVPQSLDGGRLLLDRIKAAMCSGYILRAILATSHAAGIARGDDVRTIPDEMCRLALLPALAEQEAL